MEKYINLKNKIDEMVDKAKKMNLIKPFSSTFEQTPCSEEEHEGKKESFKKILN